MTATSRAETLRRVWDDPDRRTRHGALICKALAAKAAPAPELDPVITCTCGAAVVLGPRRVGPALCSTCWADRIERVVASKRRIAA